MKPPNPDPMIEIKPYSHGELARMYGVSKQILTKWLEPHREAIGERVGHYYTSLQVKTIFDKLGIPSEKVED